jgi:ElaB/YqjD/DUF883 family membrane-anchored ribosome-binding protein
MAQNQTTHKMSNARQRSRQEIDERDVAEMSQDLLEYFREYARANPEKAALWCLGIGFILGWKLKPW